MGAITRIQLILLVMLLCLFVAAPMDFARSEEHKPKQLEFALLQSDTDQEFVKPVQQWFIKIYTEAFHRMGIVFQYRVLPPKRASAFSDQGLVDGELSRVYDYNSKHPNLVRVEEHHLNSVFSAFSTDPNLTLKGWESLKNTGYRVYYRRGIKKAAENLTRNVPSEILFRVDSINAGVFRIVKGKGEIYVEPEDGVFEYLKTDDFLSTNEGVNVYKVGVMETVTSHLWLHKKHSDLTSQISTILREMKNEGLFGQYLNELALNPAEFKW